MKNKVILVLSGIILLILGVIIFKGCFPSQEVQNRQKQLEYEKEYKRVSDQQTAERHRKMEDAINNLNKTR